MDQQIIGGHHDTVNAKNLNTLYESQMYFDQMKKVFFNINSWDQLFKKSTVFDVRNSSGEKKSGEVEIGDIVAIKIPGPENRIGNGYDWVNINNITHFENNLKRVFTLELQPCANPKGSKKIAHFFKDTAKNYFIIKKEGEKITAEVHGRNEIPNYTQLSFVDRFRNFFIANGGIFGMSKIQWEVWSKNILDENYLQKCLQNNKQHLK